MTMNKFLLCLALVLSLSACGSFGQKKAPEGAPFVCDSSAYIDETKFELQALTSLSDKEYDAWVDDMAAKYPKIKNAYHVLRGCVQVYFSQEVEEKK